MNKITFQMIEEAVVNEFFGGPNRNDEKICEEAIHLYHSQQQKSWGEYYDKIMNDKYKAHGRFRMNIVSNLAEDIVRHYWPMIATKLSKPQRSYAQSIITGLLVDVLP